MNDLLDEHQYPAINPMMYVTPQGFLKAIEQGYPDAFAGECGKETRKHLIAIWYLEHSINEPVVEKDRT